MINIAMKHNSLAQNILYLAIIALVLTTAWLLKPKTDYSPRGIFLPNSSNTYAPVAESEVIAYPASVDNLQSLAYYFKQLHQYGTPIGEIHTSIHFESTNAAELSANLEKSLNFAKKLAAEQGANRLIYASARTPKAGALDEQVIYAEALRS